MAEVKLPSSVLRQPVAPQRKPYLVEALILLTILMTAIAIFISLFASAKRLGDGSVELDQAVMLASGTAERFCVDPMGVEAERESDGLVVRCEVTPEKTEAGTLYHADIRVERDGEIVYRLRTARYVSEVS